MADVVSVEVRSRMMAGIRAKNTKPELAMRRALHRLGFRYRIHGRGLPGKPDLVFAKHRAVLFIHGCFWHGHPCYLYKPPSSRMDYWGAKIARNQQRDREHVEALGRLGWRVGVVWECAIRSTSPDLSELAGAVGAWLESGEETMDIRGPAERPLKRSG